MTFRKLARLAVVIEALPFALCIDDSGRGQLAKNLSATQVTSMNAMARRVTAHIAASPTRFHLPLMFHPRAWSV